MKIIPTNYTFDASAKTITCTDFLAIEKIAIITNITAGEIIYQFNNALKGGSLAGTVLTLDFDTTAMSDVDDLQIIIHDELPKTAGGANLVGNAKTKWRFEGRTWGWVSDEIWDLIQTWTGMTISTDWVLNGSRYLKIASWTTINQETILMSKETFRPPLNFSFWLTMSQKIVNQEVHIEFVEVDENGDAVVDTELFTAPNFNNARSWVWLIYSGTSANNASIKVRSRGISELVKAAVTHGAWFSTATGSSPNFNPTLQGEISFTADRVVTAGRTIDSNASRTEWGRSTAYVPDPDVAYKIRLRVKNLGTAPASSTDVRLHFWKVIDQTRLSVDFWAIAWSLNGSDAIPVYLLNPTSTSVTATVLPPAPTTPYFLNSLATTNGSLIITGTSWVTFIYATNTWATPAFVKLYNKATAPTVGTDIPEMIIPVPAVVWSVPWVVNVNIGFIGARFALWLWIAITWGVADTDTTAVLAGQVKVKISRTT